MTVTDTVIAIVTVMVSVTAKVPANGNVNAVVMVIVREICMRPGALHAAPDYLLD